MSPDDVDSSKYPILKDKPIEIGNTDLTRKSILVEGQIKQKYPIKEFTRKDGATGMVGSLILRDSTGIVRITFWNDDSQKIEGVEVGDVISISNLSPRTSARDSTTIELHATSSFDSEKTIKDQKTKYLPFFFFNFRSILFIN